MQAGGNLDGARSGCAGSVYTDNFSSNGGSFLFGLKCEQLNMEEVLGLLGPLDSIIDQEISDGSDASSNSSDADKHEVRKGKSFVVGTYLCYYGTIRHTLMLHLRWIVL